MGLPSARVGDNHVCPLYDGLKPHIGGAILPPGSPNVRIQGMPAARAGDLAVCAGPSDSIVMGSHSVRINGQPAARFGDKTTHGGFIIIGCPSVLIGE